MTFGDLKFRPSEPPLSERESVLECGGPPSALPTSLKHRRSASEKSPKDSRSQTPFGTALVCATPLRLGNRALSRAIELPRQSRSQMEFGNETEAGASDETETEAGASAREQKDARNWEKSPKDSTPKIGVPHAMSLVRRSRDQESAGLSFPNSIWERKCPGNSIAPG